MKTGGSDDPLSAGVQSDHPDGIHGGEERHSRTRQARCIHLQTQLGREGTYFQHPPATSLLVPKVPRIGSPLFVGTTGEETLQLSAASKSSSNRDRKGKEASSLRQRHGQYATRKRV